MDNLAALAQRYVEAVERGDKFAHARGLELAEAILGTAEAHDEVLDALEEPLRAIASELGDESRALLMGAIARLREQGRAEGRRAMLLRQLEVRFGPLPRELGARVGAASGAQLDAWQERVLDAESAGAVLDEDHSKRR